MSVPNPRTLKLRAITRMIDHADRLACGQVVLLGTDRDLDRLGHGFDGQIGRQHRGQLD